MTQNNLTNENITLPFKSDTINQNIIISVDSLKKNNQQKSLFFSHQLKTDNINPENLYKVNNDWILGILILCLVLYAFIQVPYRKRLGMIFKAFFAKHFANQLAREGNIFKERISIPLFFLYIIVFSMVIYLAITYFFNLPENININFILFAEICGVVLICWFLKAAMIKISEKIFKTGKQSYEILLNIFIFNIISGIVLLPVIILILYSNYSVFIYTALILSGLIFLYRIFREIKIGISYKNFSPLYLFLYICTLEILPLIVIAKLALKYYLITV
ncbi:MAG: DUF4271 domain-containing protein [Bacteroidales bacterium]|nr:DUF4271 domain-containing protein [Bacteroidales bacterium]MCK4639527.1 DUF4271 domain-containing protein [Bacteroidales bacterium]